MGIIVSNVFRGLGKNNTAFVFVVVVDAAVPVVVAFVVAADVVSYLRGKPFEQ